MKIKNSNVPSLGNTCHVSTTIACQSRTNVAHTWVKPRAGTLRSCSKHSGAFLSPFVSVLAILHSPWTYHAPGTARLLHALRQESCRGSCVRISINKAVQGQQEGDRVAGGLEQTDAGWCACWSRCYCLADEWLGPLITQLHIPLPQEVTVGEEKERRRGRER